MPADNYPPTQMTAPQPFYGITHERCPDVEWMNASRTFRIVNQTGALDGVPRWFLQRRKSEWSPGSSSSWITQNTAMTKEQLIAALGSRLADTSLAAYVNSQLDRPILRD